MNKWVRRMRGAVKMGLTWAAAWFVAGVLLARISPANPDLPFALLFAPLGFLTGVIFSGILVVMEARRGIDRMSLPRFTGWGLLSGVLLSGIFVVGAAFRGASLMGEFLTFGPGLAITGAACAAGSLALARRAKMPEIPATSGFSSDAVRLTYLDLFVDK